MGPVKGMGAGGSGRQGCCREFTEQGDDQEAWASLGSRVDKVACHSGIHPGGLLVTGTGPRWSVMRRGGGLMVSPEGMMGFPWVLLCHARVAVGHWCAWPCLEHYFMSIFWDSKFSQKPY